MDFTIAHIDKTLDNLGRLMPAKPNKESTRKYSLKEAVFLMATKLLEMKQTGFTSKELVKALADENVVITASTLNRYLLEYQKKSGEEAVGPPILKTLKSERDSAAKNPDLKTEQSEQRSTDDQSSV